MEMQDQLALRSSAEIRSARTRFARAIGRLANRSFAALMP